MNGFLNVLKPPGMTSHDVVTFIRKLYPKIRVGHGGTLDPGAAGVLPILLGKATRLAPFIQEFPKTYHAELYLGISTDTGDAFGRVISCSEPPLLDTKNVETVFSLFTGEIEQIPPMYSAVKSKGKKLYEYARRGQTVERPPRRVTIYSLAILDVYPPDKLLFSVKCSSGTYVRSLCEKIGEAFGCSAHMSFLVRTDSGNFELSTSSTLEELAEQDPSKELLLPPDYPFRHGKELILEKQVCEYLFSARQVSLTRLGVGRGNFPDVVDGKLQAVYTTEGDFAGLVRWVLAEDNMYMLKPAKRWQQ